MPASAQPEQSGMLAGEETSRETEPSPRALQAEGGDGSSSSGGGYDEDDDARVQGSGDKRG
jgi:hypothetical protein